MKGTSIRWTSGPSNIGTWNERDVNLRDMELVKGHEI